MTTWIKVVLAAIVAWFATDAALWVGGTWQSQAHPTDGVTVEMPGGASLTGTLSRAWSGEWVLLTDQGGEKRFKGYVAMAFRRPDRGPPMLVVFLLLGYLIGLARQRFFGRNAAAERGTRR